MPRGEFLTLTPEEFTATATAYHRTEEQHMRDEWERARMIAYYSVVPHIDQHKAKLTPQKLLPLPWDKQGTPDTLPEPTKEERKARFEQLKALRDGK
jgi:hypothetical protein